MSDERDSAKSVSLDAIFDDGEPVKGATAPNNTIPSSQPAKDPARSQDGVRPVSPDHGADRSGPNHLVDTQGPQHLAGGETAGSEGGLNGLRTVVEWLAVVIVAISAALLIKEFAFQAFEIPSASMSPTVIPGDRILVNKLSYTTGEIERGQLVVFDRPVGTPGDTDQLIKRVIGLPGETVEIREGGQLWISQAGQSREEATLLDEPYLAPGADISVADVRANASFDIWGPNCENQPREAGVCVIAESNYLVLGDNRRSSVDSRSFGPIEEDSVVGRAVWRIWPLSDLGSF